MSGKRNVSGLQEVEPPVRSDLRQPVYSAERLKAIEMQLRNGKWLTDAKGYDTRSQAYHAAGVLLAFVQTRPPCIVRKTWADRETGKFRWAVRREE